MEGGLTLGVLLASHPERDDIAADLTIVALVILFLLTGNHRFTVPSRLYLPFLAGSSALLTFLPCTTGWMWFGIPGFLAGYLTLIGNAPRERATRNAHEEDVHRAVEADRERIARDLHDLLGHSLAVITLKSEVVLRRTPQRNLGARRELSEIISTSRQALHDVRMMAHGMHHASLPGTVESVRSLLDSLGIELTARVDCGPLPQDVEAVLSAVLREGVTNMLKHSSAGHCRIEVFSRPGRVGAVIANDGALAAEAAASQGGRGLGGLATRVGCLGGRFSSGRVSEDWFQVAAELPLCAPEGLADPAVTRARRLKSA